jgi:hypothetical protein
MLDPCVVFPSICRPTTRMYDYRFVFDLFSPSFIVIEESSQNCGVLYMSLFFYVSVLAVLICYESCNLCKYLLLPPCSFIYHMLMCH